MNAPGKTIGVHVAAISIVSAFLWLPAETSAAEILKQGRDIYSRACVACHRSDGSGGMPEAPDFTDAEGPLSKPDAVLLRSIMEGVGEDPASSLMPPIGGDPQLTEQGARQVLRCIREEFGQE